MNIGPKTFAAVALAIFAILAATGIVTLADRIEARLSDQTAAVGQAVSGYIIDPEDIPNRDETGYALNPASAWDTLTHDKAVREEIERQKEAIHAREK